MDIQSDSDLVKAVLTGDKNAYGRLFEQYERSVQATALAILFDYNAAQDATQQAFVKAYMKLGELRNGSAFGPWIRKIAKREAILISRRMKKQKYLKPFVAQENEESSINRIDETNRKVLNAVMRLPAHERVVIMLHYFDDHPVKMISEMTGRPVGTITMQLSRARARLHKWLKESSI